MIDPLNYLYYKLDRDTRKFSSVSYGVPTGMVLFFGLNYLTIYALLTNGEFPSNTSLIVAILLISILVVIPFLSRKRVFRILRKYRKESDKSRIIGSLIVWGYVILTFVSAYLVARYYGK